MSGNNNNGVFALRSKSSQRVSSGEGLPCSPSKTILSIISCAVNSHAAYAHLYEITSSRQFSKQKKNTHTQRRFLFVRRSQPRPNFEFFNFSLAFQTFQGQFKGGKFALSQYSWINLSFPTGDLSASQYFVNVRVNAKVKMLISKLRTESIYICYAQLVTTINAIALVETMGELIVTYSKSTPQNLHKMGYNRNSSYSPWKYILGPIIHRLSYKTITEKIGRRLFQENFPRSRRVNNTPQFLRLEGLNSKGARSEVRKSGIECMHMH